MRSRTRRVTRAVTCVVVCTTLGVLACARADAHADAHADARADGHADTRADTEADTHAAGQPGATGVLYFTGAALSHVEDSLARTPRTAHVLERADDMQLVAVRRGAAGTPEVHDRWIDVAVVQSGRGALVYGGRVEGGRQESAGEIRGGRIVGGARRPIGPGDLMVIPAGTPHQYVIAPGDSLRYLTTKVLAARR